jgi:hypothetical protein
MDTHKTLVVELERQFKDKKDDRIKKLLGGKNKDEEELQSKLY